MAACRYAGRRVHFERLGLARAVVGTRVAFDRVNPQLEHAMNIQPDRTHRACRACVPRAVAPGLVALLLLACAGGDSEPTYTYPADPGYRPNVGPSTPATTTPSTPGMPGAPSGEPEDADEDELAAPGGGLGAGGSFAGAGGSFAGSAGLGGSLGIGGTVGIGGTPGDVDGDGFDDGAAGLGGSDGYGDEIGGYGGSL